MEAEQTFPTRMATRKSKVGETDGRKKSSRGSTSGGPAEPTRPCPFPAAWITNGSATPCHTDANDEARRPSAFSILAMPFKFANQTQPSLHPKKQLYENHRRDISARACP